MGNYTEILAKSEPWLAATGNVTTTIEEVQNEPVIEAVLDESAAEMLPTSAVPDDAPMPNAKPNYMVPDDDDDVYASETAPLPFCQRGHQGTSTGYSRCTDAATDG